MVARLSTSEMRGHLLGEAAGMLTFRVCGSEHNGGRILRIRSSKCSVGSDPHCTLRLRASGVDPVHCLILRGTEGTFIRRWSSNTSLNGHGFNESRLNAGDRLAIGPIELEVLDPSSVEDRDQQIAPADDTADETDDAFASLPCDDTSADEHSADHEPAQSTAEHQQARDKWRADYEALKAELRGRTEEWEQQRGELLKRCEKLKRDVQASEAAQRRLNDRSRTDAESQRQKQHESRTLINEMREGMAELRDTLHVQTAEQEKLIQQVSDSDCRAVTLQQQLQAAMEELETERGKTSGETQDLEAHHQEVARQIEQLESEKQALQEELCAVTSAFEEQRQQWNEKIVQWEATEKRLNDELQQALADDQRSRQQLTELEQQLQASSENAEQWQERVAQWESTEKQLNDELQQALADDQRSRQQLTELEQQLQASSENAEQWQERVAQWEATEKQLNDELQQALADDQRSRQQLTELEQQLQASSENAEQWQERVAQWESTEKQLNDELQQALADDQRSRQQLTELEQQLQASSENAEQWQERIAQWESTEKRLNDELQQALADDQRSRQQLTELEQQLQASSESAEQWHERVAQWEATEKQLNGDLQQALANEELSRQKLADLEKQLRDSSENTDQWNERVAQWESTEKQLNEELEQALADQDLSRQKLDELERQLQESADDSSQWNGQKAAEWESTEKQLNEDLEQALADQDLSRQKLDELERELQESIENTNQWKEKVAQWESTEKQLNEDLEQSLADQNLSRQKLTELERQLQETKENISKTNQPSELAAGRDIIDSLRQELRQTRQEHQQACEEWHADRKNLEDGLAVRSAALKANEAKHSTSMAEAEGLIHSLQLEGKRLLVDLDDAKQAIRRFSEMQKEWEAGKPVAEEDDPQSTAEQDSDPEERCGPALLPPTDGSMACQTQGLTPAQLSQAKANEESTPDDPQPNHAHPNRGAQTELYATTASADEALPSQTQNWDPNQVAQTEPHEVASEDTSLSQTQNWNPNQVAQDELFEPPGSADEASPSQTQNWDSSQVAQTEPHEVPATDDEAAPPPTEDWNARQAAQTEPHQGAAESDEPVGQTRMLGFDQAVQDEADQLGEADGDTMCLPDGSIVSSEVEVVDRFEPMASIESESLDDESVIQNYMERLLRRVAGGPNSDDRPAETPVRLTEVESSENQVEIVPKEVSSPVVSPMNKAEPDNDQVPVPLVAPTSVPNEDLAAMRELANSSARNAIYKSDQRRSLATALTEIGTAAICLFGGGALLAMSSRVLSSPCVGGLLGLSFGCVWLLRSFRTLWRLKKPRDV